MAKYNLISSGALRSVVISDSYNKALSNIDLAKLSDGYTTGSGVVLSGSDYLCLEVDLGARIKVDGIFLYTNDLTKLSNINFQYKNFSTDSYTTCTKAVTTTYNGVVPDPSAPQFIRCTISGVAISIYEFAILNNDYIIEFGDGGSDTTVWLQSTPIGSLGTPQELSIFNNTTNSDIPANAFACVDYTGTGNDNFLKISDSESGPFLGYEAGGILGYKNSDWNAGTHNNTTVNSTNNSLVLTNVGSCTIYYKNTLVVLPLTTAYLVEVPFGLIQSWLYATDRNTIYAVFYTASTISSGVLKLYAYTLNTNVWVFISNLYTNTLDITYFYMRYVSGYLFYRSGPNANNDVFKYNLSGAPGNYTQVPAMVSAYNVCTCTFNNYIYMIYMVQSAIQGACYDTTTGIITAMGTYPIGQDSTGATMNIFSIVGIKGQLVSDTDHGYVYFVVTNSAWKYLQRYQISSNTWQTQYFNYSTRISPNNTYLRIAYYNNKIYFFNDSYGTKCYTYDVTTDTVSNFDLGFQFHSTMAPQVLVVPPTVSGVGTFSIYAAGIKNDQYTLYGYNTGFEHNNTTVVPITTNSGTYTSPIISVDDPLSSSYFITDTTTIPGLTNVSLDPTVYSGIMEVRSSNTKPVAINEIYWRVTYPTVNTWSVTRYVLESGTFTSNFLTEGYNVYTAIGCSRRTGRIIIATRTSIGILQTHVLSRQGVMLYSNNVTFSNEAAYPAVFPLEIHIDKYDGYWMYSDNSKTMFHVRFDGVLLSSPVLSAAPYAFCAELDGDGLWYIDQSSNVLINLSSSGTIKNTISLFAPYGVCGTEDNGCWVIDRNDLVYGRCIKRYDTYGVMQQVIQVNQDLSRMTHDHAGGFYVRTSSAVGEVWHYNSIGIRDMVAAGLFGEEYLRAGRSGVVLYSTTYLRIRYLDFTTRTILWTKYASDLQTTNSNSSVGIPCIFSYDINSEAKYATQYGTSLFPTANDTVWYGDNNLTWNQVPLKGYFLPKCKYHQVRLTLYNTDGYSTPVVSSIAMAPAVKVVDILPQSSKPIYLVSNIPSNANVSNFDTRVKVWWDVPTV